MTRSTNASRADSAVKLLALLMAGVTLAVLIGAGDLWLDEGRLLSRAWGSDALARACAGPLLRQLAARGFEPADMSFGPAPRLAMPSLRVRTFGDSFTFRDGAGEARIDGVVACTVSGTMVMVDFRVGSSPRRNA